MNHSMIEVVFKVHAQLRAGEEIRVSGNVPALGCNNPARAIPLVTSKADFPWWNTKETIFLPGDLGMVSYRYCLFRGGKFVSWEFQSESNSMSLNNTSGNSSSNNSITNILSSPVFRSLNVKRDGTVKTTSDRYGLSPNATNGIAGEEPLNSVGTGGVSKASLLTSSKIRSSKARRFSEWSKNLASDRSISSSDGVILVSYFLPINLSRSQQGKWSATWDSENLLALQSNLRLARVGSVRYPGGIPVDEEDNVAEALQALNCYPVFINQQDHHQFYEIFCKQLIWPALHQVGDVYGPLHKDETSAEAQRDQWFTNTKINNKFKEKIVEIYSRGDLIWIHGFHLLLLPSFLRRVLPLAKIGLFFHTPFPSSEIWRTMTRREDLLRGVLGADHIGFHLFEYARHFLTTSKRLLGYSYEMNAAGSMAINADGREVVITCIHVGVDLPRIELALTSLTAELSGDVSYWKQKFTGKIVFAGIDRLERLKGISLKLIAIEEFMEDNPLWRDKLAFPIIGIGASERGDDYRQTQRDVLTLVQRINSKYGEVVFFEERTDSQMTLPKRMAFFATAHVLMITSAREGLNRMPMEFTLARARYGGVDLSTNSSLESRDANVKNMWLSNEGLVIISEFVSSARVMRGALTVNPWRTDDVKEALTRVLEMSQTERADRMRRNLEFSTRLTTSNWAVQVLNDLKAVKKSEDLSSYSAMGFGMGFRVLGVKSGFNSLDVSALAKSYRQTKNRLILLDWGGTLVAENDKEDKIRAYALAQGHISRSGPTDALKETLESLCSDPKNLVFVISGKELVAVNEFFGEVQGLGLAAEHGFYYKWPAKDNTSLVYGMPQILAHTTPSPTNSISASPNPTSFSPTPHGKWQNMCALGEQSWRESAMMIMDIYVQRTHGTYVEVKGNALIWQFRDADPEFGFMQSKELEEHLNDIMSGYSVEVIRGGGSADGYIEVRPSGVSKGLFLEHALSTMKALNQHADFLLAIGDDSSDEPMFEQIARNFSCNIAAYSVTVGKKPTAAQSYVDDPAAVMEVLSTLTKTALRDKRGFSAVDLLRSDEGNMSSTGLSTSGIILPTPQRPASHLDLRFSLPEDGSPPKSPPSSHTTLQSDSKSASSDSMARSTSVVDFTITEYLESINGEEQEGDDGIFF